MTTYEYKVLRYVAALLPPKESELEALIEPYALDGWRVVSTDSMQQGHFLLIFLERERQD